MRNRLLTLGILVSLAAAPAIGEEDPAKALKSKDVEVRLHAVERLVKEGGENAEELLIKALSDRDWEVVEHAARGLGERGGPDAVMPLVKQSIVGPVRRIRLAAAESLLRLDPAAAVAQIRRHMAGDRAEAACEALVTLAGGGMEGPAGEEIEGGLQRGLKAKEVRVRVAAARGITAFAGRERRDLLERLLKAPETTVRASVLNALIERPSSEDIAELVMLLGEKNLNDVLSRRVIAALVAIVGTVEPGEEADRLGRRALTGAQIAGTDGAAARFARLAGRLAENHLPPEAPEGEDPPEPPPPLVSVKTVEPALEFTLAHDSGAVRAAAVYALGRIRTEKSLDRAARLAREDPSRRVRLHALRAVARTRGPTHEETRSLLLDRLAEDPDTRVREYAAVVLGARGLSEAAPALTKALGDKAWEVAVCAAVSLGKIGDPAAIEPLRKWLGHRDFKLRGAAIIAFGKLRRREVVPDIIRALADRDSAVKRSSWEILKRIARREIDPTVKAWASWWNGVKDSFEFPDLEEMARQAKKYGYAQDYRGVYEDLDVIVLQSRGDSIEKLLARLTIRHRMTRSGQLTDAGLNPHAVFVANCTGEIVPKDVERLAWFVRTGGYLFGSCWALHETIELVYPGVVRKLPIPGQVLANVLAEPCPTESRYLDGVFGDGITRPIYVLYGAHLIEVLDPERVEVLIDSPQCADTWPEGNLACWFDAGHGVILDSANHFDLQGLERVDGLKTAADRMGYAMDHMGLSYEDLRNLARKKVWGSRTKAAGEARDFSAFRFITNFVRHKRRVDR